MFGNVERILIADFYFHSKPKFGKIFTVQIDVKHDVFKSKDAYLNVRQKINLLSV